jgi:putative membrane protein
MRRQPRFNNESAAESNIPHNFLKGISIMLKPVSSLPAGLAAGALAAITLSWYPDVHAAPHSIVPPAMAATASHIMLAANAPAPASGATENPAASKTFVAKAATGGMEEVELAELALSKSSSPAVDDFAKKMKHDHTAANVKLASIAKEESISVPGGLTAQQQKKMKQLKAESGAEFDKEYAATMVTAHKKTIALFENASHKASSQQLRQFAKDSLPMLYDHLKLAEAMQSKVAGANARNGGK